MDGHDLDVRLDVVPRALGPDAVAEPAEHGGELVAAVQPHAAVADEVAERGDALDVVAEVGRRAVGARVAVVHDRDRAAATGRRRGRRARVGGDPVAERVAVARGVRPRLGVPGDVLVEAGEHGTGQLLLAGAERRGEQLVPGARADPGRVLGRERADGGLGLLRRLGEARAHPLRRRERRGRGRRHARQLGVGEREEAAVVGHDRGDDRARPRRSPGAPAAATPWRAPSRSGRPRGARGRARPVRRGRRAAWQAAAAGRRRAGAARRAGRGRSRQPRTTRSFAPCSSVKPSCAAKYSSTARRQPDHL